MALIHYASIPSQRFFEEGFNHMCDNWFGPGEVPARVNNSWKPPVDIHEERDRLVILADLPGVERSDITVKAENGLLTIAGERRPQTAAKEENTETRYHHRERNQGPFERVFRLPENVDSEGIRANHAQGVLEITLPKSQRARSKNIDVTYLQ